MRIEEDIKLDYADVLFRPKRSTLSSRKDVELKRTYKFKYSNHQWSGIPIIAANMDGVGEIEVANNLFASGVNVITSGNHVWDQKETFKHIERENRLLRPKNMIEPSPGKGFGIYNLKNGLKVGVLNLMGNIFMK